MIERLATSLRAIGALGGDELGTPDGQRLLGDCADALRLELDCPQQSLTPTQRVALARLSDLLEENRATTAELGEAARRVRAALGI